MSGLNRVLWVGFILAASILVWQGEWTRATFAVAVVILIEIRSIGEAPS